MATQPLALQTTPSAQVQRGMPEGQLTATMAAFKGLPQIAEDKKLSDKPATHVLPAHAERPLALRAYCELVAYVDD